MMWRCLASTLLMLAGECHAAVLAVHLPSTETLQVANALERGSSVVLAGHLEGNAARFEVSPSKVYDLAVETKSGLLICGADMSWCDSTAKDVEAEPLGDDDRAAIKQIVTDVRGFANKQTIVRCEGDHDRAVALVSLVRDNGFHSNSGDEIIWRAEVWFFRWQNGAWEKVANQSRVLRRERFVSRAEFQKEVDRIRWAPELGGVHVPKDAPLVTIELLQEANELTPPTTRASNSTAESHPTTLFAP